MAEDAPPLPLPQPTDVDRPFWEAATEGRLLLQRCRATGAVWARPQAASPATGRTADVEWFEARGFGRVFSFTVVRHAPDPAFQARSPYVLALIDLDEGARMLAGVVGPDALETRIGDPVRVVFEARGHGFNAPQFVRNH